MISLLALALATSTPALAGGGGGITFDGAYLPRYGDRDAAYEAPGRVGCLGFTGHGFDHKTGFRVGGEAHLCRNSRGIRTTEGGAQFGFRRGKTFWWTTTIGIGVGTLKDHTGESKYRSLYGYLKPQAGIGVHLGGFAVEVGPYVTVPLNVVQWVGAGPPRGFVTPHGGLMASFMIGKWKRPDPPPPPVAPPAPAAPPVQARPPQPAPIMPAPTPPRQPETSDQPLAIPG